MIRSYTDFMDVESDKVEIVVEKEKNGIITIYISESWAQGVKLVITEEIAKILRNNLFKVLKDE